MQSVDLDLLRFDAVVIEGLIGEASNSVYLGALATQPQHKVIYKPISGERELWDFPTGTLSGREVAVYEIDRLLGAGLIPPTVWRTDLLHGPGSLQLMVQEDDSLAPAAQIVRETHEELIPVVALEDRQGHEWLLCHRDDERLRRLALLDAIINNGDRKAGHILAGAHGYVGIDHGVSLHSQPKLRTVLWGWAGEPISPAELAWLQRGRESLEAAFDILGAWIDNQEWAALVRRFDDLLDSGRFPQPSAEWPALPWPLF